MSRLSNAIVALLGIMGGIFPYMLQRKMKKEWARYAFAQSGGFLN